MYKFMEKNYTRAIAVTGGYILTDAQNTVTDAQVKDSVSKSLATDYSYAQYPKEDLAEIVI